MFCSTHPIWPYNIFCDLSLQCVEKNSLQCKNYGLMRLGHCCNHNIGDPPPNIGKFYPISLDIFLLSRFNKNLILLFFLKFKFYDFQYKFVF